VTEKLQQDTIMARAVILAAGEGTRMRSSLPKVLHEIANLPIVGHVIKTAKAAGMSNSVLVVGREAEKVAQTATSLDENLNVTEQKERLGTAHAVLAARDHIEGSQDDLIVLFGDTPLMRVETLQSVKKEIAASDTAVVVVGFKTNEPTGYGRLLMQDGELTAIREEKDASLEEKRVTFCNSGIMALKGAYALQLLDAVNNNNTKGEYYLTDVVEIARAQGLKVKAIEAPFEDVLGINNRLELSQAEAIWQRRRREELMLSGVTMQAPETVYLSHDTQIEPDVMLEPNITFGSEVHVKSGAHIRGFSYLEGATVEAHAVIGPYARLRPGAEIGEYAKVGNFCEVKKARVAEHAKINHLTYIGDATIGAYANIGAGTITCNYDGKNKHLTQIGANAFIGSNSALVAPVTIADNAYIASGSVITKDVPENALAFGRARQTVKNNWNKNK
jgi:bifunctional UDP-N-acetylglucosamine pyrophosphorylase/glucosamine-1-phosphate N-acetyltransferase